MSSILSRFHWSGFQQEWHSVQTANSKACSDAVDDSLLIKMLMCVSNLKSTAVLSGVDGEAGANRIMDRGDVMSQVAPASACGRMIGATHHPMDPRMWRCWEPRMKVTWQACFCPMAKLELASTYACC
jgi:hypothetical protein